MPLYGFGQRLDTEGSVQGVGESPGQYLAAGPVHDGHEIGKALSHWQVGYVGTPDVVGNGDIHASQQVRIDLVLDVGNGGAGPAVDGADSHQLYELGDMAPTDVVSQAAQFVHDPAAAVEGICQVDLVDMPHHLQVILSKGLLLVVDAGPGKLEQVALPGCRQRMLGRDHFFALVP